VHSVTVRDDLRALEGYHSPQVDVRVRLNTNEAPTPPPTAWRDAFAAELSRVEWHRYPDRSAAALRSAIADSHHVRSDQVFAANGSNEVLQTLLLAAQPGLLVVDEAYGQFADWSALTMIDESTPLVVTRTFSKTWSMAASRLGYVIGPSWLIAELDKVALPYHLDAAKQIAGRLALQFTDDMDARVAQIVSERERIAATLGTLDLEVFPSGANFILFRPRNKPGRQVWQELLDRSILIRDCSGWPRLTDCLRVTVGTPEENDEFLQAIREIVQ